MKITAVRPILLSAPYGSEDELELRQSYPKGKRSALFVRVETDAGISGLGETYTGVFVPELAARLVDILGGKMIGSDPLDVADLHSRMIRFVSYWGHKGFCKGVISALEIALWDLKGKALGVPVYQLLGGAKTERISLYASGGIQKSEAALEQELRSFAEAGFQTVKIRDRDLRPQLVAQARFFLGPAVDLIVDTNQSFTFQPAGFRQALGYARQIEPYRIAFLEEPLGVDDLHGYCALVESSPVPISGGETLTSAVEFRRHMEARAFHIVQPDATVTGGILECLGTLQDAPKHGIEAICHAFGAAPCQAANVHAAFAAGSRLLEWAMPYNPLREELLVEPWTVRDGQLLRPSLPGLGIHLPPEVMARYPFDPETANPGKW